MKSNYIFIVLAIVIWSIMPAFAASGDIDTLFGNNGSIEISSGYSSYPGGYKIIAKTIVQPDNKIVVAGSRMVYNGSNYSRYVMLRRYTPDGAIDTSFGFLGESLTFKSADIQIADAVLQANGEILISGYIYSQSSDFFIARFLSNGNPDTTFGNGGFVTTDFFGSSDQATTMAIRDDGRIVVAGWAFDGNNQKFAVARYYSNGNLDTSFSGNGKKVIGWGEASNLANSVALLSNNKILVGGAARLNGVQSFAFAQFNADGTLDSSFGTGGKVTTDFGSPSVIYSISLQPDKYTSVAGKKILAVGNTLGNPQGAYGGYIAAARYNPDGSLDPSFGSGGMTITAPNSGYSHDQSYSRGGFYQTDKKIIIVTANLDVGAIVRQQISVTRFNLSGTLDMSFGNAGQVNLDNVEPGTGETGGALQSNGKIIVYGNNFIKRLLP